MSIHSPHFRTSRLSTSLGARSAVLLLGAAALFLGLLLASACGSAAKRTWTVEEIRADLNHRITPEMLARVEIPFEIDDEIRELAFRVTENLRTDKEKMRAIVRAIRQHTGGSISYDWLSNKTAKSVFREGRGNCLAYTNLFVGMSRAVGVEAIYVDVTTIEKVTKEAEVIVNSGHITGGIKDGPDLIFVDFTANPEREYAGAKIIDDFEAIANFYNNQGFLYGYFAEALADQGGFDPLAREIEMYELALSVRPKFNRARNNLGVAFKRRGRVDEAIEQYRLALDIDPDFTEARSNLASAYYSQGDSERAVTEFRHAARNDDDNAYVHYHLGVLHYHAGDYPAAVQSFRRALSRDRRLADARFFLGETLLKLGDEDEAMREYERAIEIDPNYIAARAKLDLLRDRRTLSGAGVSKSSASDSPDAPPGLR